MPSLRHSVAMPLILKNPEHQTPGSIHPMLSDSESCMTLRIVCTRKSRVAINDRDDNGYTHLSMLALAIRLIKEPSPTSPRVARLLQ